MPEMVAPCFGGPCQPWFQRSGAPRSQVEVELEEKLHHLRGALQHLTDIQDGLISKLAGGGLSAGDAEDGQEEAGKHAAVARESFADDSDAAVSQESPPIGRGISDWFGDRVNGLVMSGSVLGMAKPKQVLIYGIALAGVIFVLAATATGLGAGDDADADEGHRRLFGDAPVLLRNIAFSLTGVGLLTWLMFICKQPLILGYLLGGVLIGPIGLKIVKSHHDIAEISELGLIFLLFMIGMELDIKELLKMGKVVLLTGLLQYPVCAGVMYCVFAGLQAIGLSFGGGTYAALYCGLTCGISSTMIVAKMLGQKGEMEQPTGRLTVGILIFQDIWAIIVLAVQPNLANPEILGILKTFGMIAILIIVALAYAKLIMPATLFFASRSVELMLVLSLAWCFFICCTANLPFIGLSMELAALIAGVALAAFPYSAEFNGKIKYIRDFFITLFFAGLGMQIPVPTPGDILMGILVAIVVLIFRWLGIFALVWLLGGGAKLGAISTINLSQISEFALVICSMGMGFGHIDGSTMTIIIWTFAILAIAASYLIGFNSAIYRILAGGVSRLMCRGPLQEQDGEGDGEEHDHRDIVFLGFHKVAAMLVAEFQMKNPRIINRVHVIDVNQNIMPGLRKQGLKCSYGDYATPDVLEHVHHGEATIVVCTIPDSLLQRTTNAHLLKISREVWPKAHYIVTADNPYQAQQLYTEGADYVVRMARLCAERIYDIVSDHCGKAFGSTELRELFEHYKRLDKDHRTSGAFSAVKVS